MYGSLKYEIKLKIIFSGKKNEISNELIDELLISSDSCNPLRPFRWYKYTPYCADINSKKSINQTRKKSFQSLLDKIDNPKDIWIFEIIS